MTTLPDNRLGEQPHLAYTLRRIDGFIPLPIAVVREHGQAAQTLGGLLAVIRQDGRYTFRRQELIAKAAGLSLRTLRRHLATLESAGVITSTRQGRRTQTYRLVGSEAELLASGFLPLPRFAMSLPWSERLTYAWLVFRAEVSWDGATVEDSNVSCAKTTGMNRHTVGLAISALAKLRLIEHEMTPGSPARITLIMPTKGSWQKMAATQKGWQKVATDPGRKWRGGWQKVATVFHERRTSKEYMVQEKENKSMDQICIQVEVIATLAGRIFRKAGYDGSEGKNLWKLAALLQLGLISEAELWGSVEGSRSCGAKNPPAYIYQTIRERTGKRGMDLRSAAAAVRILPNWPSGPPQDDLVDRDHPA